MAYRPSEDDYLSTTAGSVEPMRDKTKRGFHDNKRQTLERNDPRREVRRDCYGSSYRRRRVGVIMTARKDEAL